MTNDIEEEFAVSLDLNEIRQLLLAIDRTEIEELTLKTEEFELTVRKGMGSRSIVPAPAVPGESSNIAAELHFDPAKSPAGMDSASRRVDTAAMNSTAGSAAGAPPLEQKFVEISSPMVGTFYRAPAPSEPPFVEVSDRVRSGQTVCIIEAMKLMNEIEAEVSGQVMEILVQNGEPVEYGQPLMRINPD
jgi:acetyl-CoA carboxylase biotin carboxyl carrier protein